LKYIKKFENTEQFNVGDYILIKPNHFKDKLSRPAKIIETETVFSAYDNIQTAYIVNTVDLKGLWIYENMVDRKLNKEEIEQFKLDCFSKKFNL